MMLLDRVTPPNAHLISHLEVQKPLISALNNDIALYCFPLLKQPVVRIEFIFDAGSTFESKLGTANFASKMLTEGTKKYTSKHLHEAFDRVGAFFESQAGSDRLVFTVHCLEKHLFTVLPLVQDLIENSIFPEKEWDISIKNTLENIRVSNEKTSFVASKLLRSTLFGKHPYGKSLEENDVKNINREEAKAFYEKYIKQGLRSIIVIGQANLEGLEARLNAHFAIKKIKINAKSTPISVSETAQKPILIEKAGAMQSSIRLGKVLFNRQHEDFFSFIVMNQVFGGYFGSRLMKNIREEKGFTYGISSSLVAMKEAGYWLIGTDVACQHTQQTIDEIKKEIEILQQTFVPIEELEAAKNHLIGSMAGSLNNPFEAADRYKNILFDGLSPLFYDNFVEKIRSISPEMVQQMAQKHIRFDSLHEVVVGGK